MASKPICKYGASCYRKNPDHFKQYSHPGSSEGEEKSDDEPMVRQERRRGRGVPTRHTGAGKDVSCTAILRYDLCNHTTQWILEMRSSILHLSVSSPTLLTGTRRIRGS